MKPAGPAVTAFFEPRTFSVQYVVTDENSSECAIIDPVLDYDEKSGSIATNSADRLLRYVNDNKFQLRWVLDTHPHADHLSAANYIRERTGVKIGIGTRVVEVQKTWQNIYGLDSKFRADGSQWDLLLADGDKISLGRFDIEAIFSPGHTLASVSYLIADCVFVHDTLFMPDSGTARCDFPGGDAAQLWQTIQRLLSLPPDTRVFVGHDYQPGGREPRWETTIREQRSRNIHLAPMTNEQAFVAMRDQRDVTLPLPRLMLHALQVNIAAGSLPPADDQGRQFLRIPVNAFRTAMW